MLGAKNIQRSQKKKQYVAFIERHKKTVPGRICPVARHMKVEPVVHPRVGTTYEDDMPPLLLRRLKYSVVRLKTDQSKMPAGKYIFDDKTTEE